MRCQNHDNSSAPRNCIEQAEEAPCPWTWAPWTNSLLPSFDIYSPFGGSYPSLLYLLSSFIFPFCIFSSWALAICKSGVGRHLAHGIGILETISPGPATAQVSHILSFSLITRPFPFPSENVNSFLCRRAWLFLFSPPYLILSYSLPLCFVHGDLRTCIVAHSNAHTLYLFTNFSLSCPDSEITLLIILGFPSVSHSQIIADVRFTIYLLHCLVTLDTYI